MEEKDDDNDDNSYLRSLLLLRVSLHLLPLQQLLIIHGCSLALGQRVLLSRRHIVSSSGGSCVVVKAAVAPPLPALPLMLLTIDGRHNGRIETAVTSVVTTAHRILPPERDID